MDIGNAEHDKQYFPVQYWDAGDNALSISRLEWDDEKRIMLFGDNTIVYGEQAKKPDIAYGAPQRLYSSPDQSAALASTPSPSVRHGYRPEYR